MRRPIFAAKHSTLPEQSTRSIISSKGWIVWPALTMTEKVVCTNISLIPLWWMSGLYQYWAGLICLGIVCWEITRYQKIRLRWPNVTVAALMGFCAYQCIGMLMFSLETGLVSVTAVNRLVMFWLPPTLLMWYIQSNHIRVRLPAVAWACSILSMQMVAFWIVGQLILGGGAYEPPRSLFSLLSGNASGTYDAGKGLANYLIPYRPEDKVFADMARWSYFFLIPELAALASAFIALVALDLSNKRWMIALLMLSVLLVIMSGTRSVWLALPFVILLRYSLVWGRSRGYFIPLAVLALSSFLLLAIPTITSSVLDTYAQASESVSSYRGDSSEVRGEIYARTIEAIPDRLLFGHWIPGETVLPGFDLGRVGTHSFILSSLLYQLGLIGTLLFIAFWFSLGIELFKMHHNRPLAGICLWALYTLLCVPMEFGIMPAVMLVLLSVMLYEPSTPAFTSHTTPRRLRSSVYLNQN